MSAPPREGMPPPPPPRRRLTQELLKLVADEEENSVQYDGHMVWNPEATVNSVGDNDPLLPPDFDGTVDRLVEGGDGPLKIRAQELAGLVGECEGSTEWARHVAELVNLRRPPVIDDCVQGEMFYQQAVFSPLSLLFYSFNPGHYRADQDVWPGFKCTLKQQVAEEKTQGSYDDAVAGTNAGEVEGGSEATAGSPRGSGARQQLSSAAAAAAAASMDETGATGAPSPAAKGGGPTTAAARSSGSCSRPRQRQRGGDGAQPAFPGLVAQPDSEGSERPFKPDAALVACPERSSLVLGMMELKAFVPNTTTINNMDMYKCVLLTSVTAVAIIKSGAAERVSIPFVLNVGETADLYVTSMGRDSQAPEVKLVCTADKIGSMKERVELFAKLAALLGSAVECMDSRNGRWLRKLVKGPPPKRSRSTSQGGPSPKMRKTCEGKSDGRASSSALGSAGPRSHCQRTGPGQAEEGIARCGGRVGDLLPLEPFGHGADPPYYYAGTLHRRRGQGGPSFDDERPSGGMPVFVKVWRDGDDASPELVESETELLQLAHREGVPCPEVIPELSQTSIQCFGSTFHRLVMRRLANDPVPAGDLERYAASLIKTVQKLHEAGVLHCDIKPSNVLWNSTTGTASLVDFGHAQREAGATAYVGTEGYTAPEVEHGGEPHGRVSEAYSVGKTILKAAWKAGVFQSSDGSRAALRAAEGLSREDPESRLTLAQALAELTAPARSPGAPSLTPRAELISGQPSQSRTTSHQGGKKVAPYDQDKKDALDSP